MSQLAHMDHTLAEDVWLHFFPSVWQILSEKQRESLSNELVPFICSGAHMIQRDCHPSALNTFVEAVSRCQPCIEIEPALLKYLGKSHNLWHRSTLLLEKKAFDGSFESGFGNTNDGTLKAMDSLSEMYSLLKEEDMWAGLWQRKAKYQVRKSCQILNYDFIFKIVINFFLKVSVLAGNSNHSFFRRPTLPLPTNNKDTLNKLRVPTNWPCPNTETITTTGLHQYL